MVKKTLQKKTKKASHKALKAWVPAVRRPTTMNDIKTAVLLVSLAINIALFIGWLALRLTTVYDAQVYNILFNR